MPIRVWMRSSALLPAFCGKGFYGDRVHEAVLASGVKVTGCTVHFCDDEYDRLWKIFTEYSRVFPAYYDRMDRELRMFRLSPR